ncbi:MAG: di-trans,poly-cis-decaprenylcistransferase [Zetaproteobacteria bacterium]|nr:MAG: di-trans,poly-cis-decaprenylcistransferase [Zetaproteobacteria bacterium]
MSLDAHPEQRVIPRHVGIIMDGNGRWAKAHHLPRIEGHRRGAQLVRDVAGWAVDAGVRQLSLYAFSTENWSRPQQEVRGLMQLLSMMARSMLKELRQNGVRLRVLGDVARLPQDARDAVLRACEQTQDGDTLDLVLCLSYGGQQEIVAGVRKALAWAMAQPDPQAAIAALDEQRFREFLWRADLLPVDLLIRTGGEMRISNFHLWDAAYAELCFLDVYWPDFTRALFFNALSDYAGRERRFGLISEQLSG